MYKCARPFRAGFSSCVFCECLLRLERRESLSRPHAIERVLLVLGSGSAAAATAAATLSCAPA